MVTGPKVGRSADGTLWGAKRLRVYALYTIAPPIPNSPAHPRVTAESTAENKQKGNQATMATMLRRSYSLLLVYFVAEV